VKTKKIDDLKLLAKWLDSRFQLPFGFSIGWDAILGFIPILGDIVTVGLSFYILARAALLGCPPPVLVRMGFNILWDNIFDAIPILGNIFDIFWKSNNRNILLIEKYLAHPDKTAQRSHLIVVFGLCGILMLILALISVSIYIGVQALLFLVQYVGSLIS
jgi:hypothetical protein